MSVNINRPESQRAFGGIHSPANELANVGRHRPCFRKGLKYGRATVCPKFSVPIRRKTIRISQIKQSTCLHYPVC